MTRSLAPTEHCEQVAVMQWARTSAHRYPALDMLYHVANGGSRHRIEAARLKAAGVKPGVPDLALDVARGGYHGLRIELKRMGGKLSPTQVVWLDRLREEGYYAQVCWGAEDAIRTIEKYLRLDNGK